jgi:hypothetical protein
MRLQDAIRKVEAVVDGGAGWVFPVIQLIAECAMQRGPGASRPSGPAWVDPTQLIASPLGPQIASPLGPE